MYHILIRGRNCAKYIHDCLESVKNQSHTDWRAHVVLDAHTDESYDIARECQDLGITIRLNTERKGLCYNIYNPIKWMHPKDEDVISILDADDTLHYHALKVVNKVYREYPDTLITHGSYIKRSKGRTTKISRAYPPGADPRTHSWRCSHLKTLKYKVFKHIPESYFKDNAGNWLDAASDLALMIPAMEIAGMEHVRFVPKPIYFWNDSYGGNTKRELQKVCENIVRCKKALKRRF